ncbi:MAG: DUF1801 domain-containing protein [Parafilimonas sp.]
MTQLKTKQTGDSVIKFLNTVEDEQKRKDCFDIIEIMQQVTGLQPKMWGTAIIGFGSYHYKYESGHESDMCIIGFSPRKQNITLYVKVAAEETNALFDKLGKHKTGKGCLYINKLNDLNIDVLKKIIKTAFEYMKAKYA